MDAEATALSKRVVACFQNLEVEAVGAGDIAFRSALRKCLVQAHALARQVVEENRGPSFGPMLFEAFRFISLFHGIVPAGSLCAHVSARDFWAEEMNGVSHVSIDELKKALQQHLPKGVGEKWVGRLTFEGHGVAEKDFAVMTDELGLVGGIARAANRVCYVKSPPGAATLQIASTWEDDLRAGKPLRQALDSLGTVNKWAECDAVGGMLVEMCEEAAVVLAASRGAGLPKGLVGRGVMRSTETVDQAYARLPVGTREEPSKAVVTLLLQEACEQAEHLVGVQVRARDMLAQASDAAWRERMQILLEVLRRLISAQTARVNALRAQKESLKEDGSKKGLGKLLNPIRKASSSALATLAEKRRSSANMAQIEVQPPTLGFPLVESKTAASQLIAEEETTPRRRAQTMGTPGGSVSLGNLGSIMRPVAVAKQRNESVEEESSSEGGSLRTSGATVPQVSSVASAGDTAASSPPVSGALAGVPEPKKGNSLTRPRTKTGGNSSSSSRRKSRTAKREQDDDAASSSAGSGATTPTLGLGPVTADDSTDMVFTKVMDQLRVAQVALQAREERLRLREGRLRAKKRAMLKRQAAYAEKTEATRAELDQRERALEAREAAYEARMKRLTRLQKEEHMRNLIASFTEAQVVPLQRALRKWMCRRALGKACRLVLTAELFKDARRRNAALSEIFTSEVAHVARMEQMSLFRSMLNEQFPAGGRHGLPSHAKIFLGLDEAIEASKMLLKELGLQKSKFPATTSVAGVFEKWCPQHMGAYKLFVNNYDLSNAALQELRGKKAYSEFEQQMAARGLPALDSLLICPIQRLPRYRLLLEALLSFTPEEHCDRRNLLSAVEVVRAGVDAANHGKAVAEKMQVLLSLDECIFGQDPALPVVVSDRQLVYKGLLGDVMDPRAPLKQYFLFSDALFEVVPRKKSGLLSARRVAEEYDFSRAFLLGAAGVDLHEIPPSVMSNGFTVKNPVAGAAWKEVSFFAPSPQDLRAWVVALKNLRRLHATRKVVCSSCGASCSAGVDRCHVCKAPLEDE